MITAQLCYLNSKIFYDTVNFILYKNADGIKLLKMVSKLNDRFLWYGTGRNYNKVKYGIKEDFDEVIVEGTIEDVQNECKQIEELLSDKKWENDEFRIELLLAAQGVCVCAEQYEKLMGKNPARTVDVDKWLEKFSQKWLEKNKPSELFRLQDVFNVLEK